MVHGTIGQAYKLLNKIVQSFSDEEICNCVILDLEKAFDKVPHDKLI